MAKRRVVAIVKIQLPAGKATPAPPVGTALGPHGVQTMEFCKQYNAATEDKAGQVIPVEITIFEDRSFTFVLKTPPTPVLIRQAAGLEKGSATAGRQVVGTITDAQVAEIAQIKMPDLNANDIEAAKPRWPAPPGPWASKSRLDNNPGARGRPHPGPANEREAVMPKHGKKYVDAARRLDREQAHGPGEALDLASSLTTAKFDETVELAVRLGVDPRRADQVVRGTVALPSGTGKQVRVAVFAAGEAAEAARAAGADVVGSDDLVARVDGGFMDFDVAIATPDLMGQVGRLGRKLGPRGLMPNPKTGTVTTDVGRAVTEFKGGRVEYRADTRSRGVVQVPIGKASFTREQLLANFRAVIDELQPGQAGRGQGQVHQVGRRVLHHGARYRRRHQPPAGYRRGARRVPLDWSSKSIAIYP